MTEMQDVDHTHPHTDEPFGDTFRRGPDVAADGGERSDGTRTSSELRSDGSGDSPSESQNGSEETDEQQTDDEEMEDVDHESPTEGAKRTFERGTEGRDASV